MLLPPQQCCIRRAWEQDTLSYVLPECWLEHGLERTLLRVAASMARECCGARGCAARCTGCWASDSGRPSALAAPPSPEGPGPAVRSRPTQCQTPVLASSTASCSGSQVSVVALAEGIETSKTGRLMPRTGKLTCSLYALGHTVLPIGCQSTQVTSREQCVRIGKGPPAPACVCLRAYEVSADSIMSKSASMAQCRFFAVSAASSAASPPTSSPSAKRSAAQWPAFEVYRLQHHKMRAARVRLVLACRADCAQLCCLRGVLIACCTRLGRCFRKVHGSWLRLVSLFTETASHMRCVPVAEGLYNKTQQKCNRGTQLEAAPAPMCRCWCPSEASLLCSSEQTCGARTA